MSELKKISYYYFIAARAKVVRTINVNWTFQLFFARLLNMVRIMVNLIQMFGIRDAGINSDLEFGLRLVNHEIFIDLNIYV